MFTRRKPNKSGSTSVQVVVKTRDRRQRVVKSLGVGHTEHELLELERQGQDYIDSLSLQYGKDSLTINIIFTILYMGMIAEENKAGTVLGKRIKRLGMHFLLISGTTAEYASNFMRGMRAYEIKSICQSCGF